MTIKGLKDFLRKKVPCAFITLPYKKLEETRIVIDADNFMYQKRSNALVEIMNKVDLRSDPIRTDYEDELDNLWVKLVLDFAIRLFQFGIISVFIFDGKHLPEKTKTKDERKSKTQINLDKIALLEDELLMLDPFDRPDDKIEALRKLKSQTITYNREKVEYLKRMLQLCGIPVLTAYSDAEQLCCMLVRSGYASAVFSQDSDCIAYGARFILVGYVKGRPYYNPAFKAIFFDPILPILGLSEESFRDFCIMCGCDYNTRIPQIGPAKSFKLITEHTIIENLPEKLGKYNLDRELLKPEFCRPFFSPQEWHTLLDEQHIEIPSLDPTPESPGAREILTNHNLGEWSNMYYSMVKKIPPPPLYKKVKGYEKIIITSRGFVIRIVQEDDSDDERAIPIHKNMVTNLKHQGVNPAIDMIF